MRQESTASTVLQQDIHTQRTYTQRNFVVVSVFCANSRFTRADLTLSSVVANGKVRSGLGELIVGLNEPRNLDK
jgi:hypothetical protein